MNFKLFSGLPEKLTANNYISEIRKKDVNSFTARWHHNVQGFKVYTLTDLG